MRIITGRHKGRRLLGPENQRTTRPITDRMKTALFDSLAHADRLAGGVVLDLFSGTGSIGLECLSRGARHVTFVEKDRSARQRLKRNLATVGVGKEGEIIGGDALSPGLGGLLPRGDYTLLFMDPPYRMMFDAKHRRRLARQMGRLGSVARAGALMVVRVEEHAEPLVAAGWRLSGDRRLGSMRVDFYEVAGEADDSVAGMADEAGEAGWSEGGL